MELREKVSQLSAELKTVEHRMARETDDLIYQSLMKQFKEITAQQKTLTSSLNRLQDSSVAKDDDSYEAKIKGAMSLLHDTSKILHDPNAKAQLIAVFQRLGMCIGLRFKSCVMGKEKYRKKNVKPRVLQKLVSGQIVFGGSGLPVLPFGDKNLNSHSRCHGL